LLKTKRSPYAARQKSPDKVQQALTELMGELVHRADIPAPPPLEGFTPEARQLLRTAARLAQSEGALFSLPYERAAVLKRGVLTVRIWRSAHQ
jgi:hypothetical protein